MNNHLLTDENRKHLALLKAFFAAPLTDCFSPAVYSSLQHFLKQSFDGGECVPVNYVDLALIVKKHYNTPDGGHEKALQVLDFMLHPFYALSEDFQEDPALKLSVQDRIDYLTLKHGRTQPFLENALLQTHPATFLKTATLYGRSDYIYTLFEHLAKTQAAFRHPDTTLDRYLATLQEVRQYDIIMTLLILPTCYCYYKLYALDEIL